jgi:hypothetical protein
LIQLAQQRNSSVASVISVDLALKRWADVGIAVLTDEGACIRVEFRKLADGGTSGPRDAQELVAQLLDLARAYHASILLVDGPQAWKDPDNGIAHMRICERELRTPAKTGLPGEVKPITWTPFVSFSIDVFDALQSAGFERLATCEPVGISGNGLLLEVFPTSAWRNLGMSCLPAKAKATREDVIAGLTQLGARYCLSVDREPTHDELQALVSGLAGIAIARRRPNDYSVHGVTPTIIGGTWREGFIVNPRLIQKATAL